MRLVSVFPFFLFFKQTCECHANPVNWECAPLQYRDWFPQKIHHVSALYVGSAGLWLPGSTQSLLLQERESLSGAREAQGSIIDLTSQSCRALSPSFTPHIPPTAKLTLMPLSTHPPKHTTTYTKHGPASTRTLYAGRMSARFSLPLSFSLCLSHTHTDAQSSLLTPPLHTHYFSSLEKLNGVKLSAGPSVSWVFGKDEKESEQWEEQGG